MSQLIPIETFTDYFSQSNLTVQFELR